MRKYRITSPSRRFDILIFLYFNLQHEAKGASSRDRNTDWKVWNRKAFLTLAYFSAAEGREQEVKK